MQMRQKLNDMEQQSASVYATLNEKLTDANFIGTAIRQTMKEGPEEAPVVSGGASASTAPVVSGGASPAAPEPSAPTAPVA